MTLLAKLGAPAQRAKLEQQHSFLVRAGHHTHESPVLASRADELDGVRRAAVETPALVAFSRALYRQENVYLVPRALATEASWLAATTFERYVSRYSASGVTPQNAVDWTSPGPATTDVNDNELAGPHKPWWIYALVGEPACNATHCVPRGLAALHELMHVEEARPRRPRYSALHDPLVELLPTAATIVEADALHKQLTRRRRDEVVNYGHSVTWSNCSVPLGVLANRMRELVAVHGTYGAAFASRDALGFLAGESSSRRHPAGTGTATSR